MILDTWDYYEVIDELGQSYYRWNARGEIMEWWCDGEGWCSAPWTPATMARYAEMYDDVSVTLVTEDDVR